MDHSSVNRDRRHQRAIPGSPRGAAKSLHSASTRSSCHLEYTSRGKLLQEEASMCHNQRSVAVISAMRECRSSLVHICDAITPRGNKVVFEWMIFLSGALECLLISLGDWKSSWKQEGKMKHNLNLATAVEGTTCRNIPTATPPLRPANSDKVCSPCRDDSSQNFQKGGQFYNE